MASFPLCMLVLSGQTTFGPRPPGVGCACRAGPGGGGSGKAGAPGEGRREVGSRCIALQGTHRLCSFLASSRSVPLRCIAFRFNAGFATHWAVLPFVRPG
jgi:hypothetical protein